MISADNKYLDIDATICRAVTECGTKAALRHALGYSTPGERAEFVVGKAVHEAIAAYLQGVPVAECLRGLRELLEPAAALVPREDRRQPANVMQIMRRWFTMNPLDRLPVHIEAKHVEVGFSVEIGRSPAGRVIRYVGRCDGIGTDRAGDWWIVEHKTTSRISPYWTDRWKLDGQVTGYVVAAAQLMEKRVIGCMINGIGITRLPSSDKHCREHGVKYAECGPTMHVEMKWLPVTRTSKQIETWIKTVWAVAASYEKLLGMVSTVDDLKVVDMAGTYNNSCQWCQFQDYCILGRPTVGIESMLVHDPWRPFEHAGLKG